MGINPSYPLRRGRRAALCAVVAFVTLAGSSGLAPVGAQTAPPTTAPDFPNFGLSVERGPGTMIDITVTNTGPRAIAPAPTYPTSGFSLTLDKGSSGSKYMVAAGIKASAGWTCSAQYDVVGCSVPGTFGIGQTMTLSVPMNLCYPSDHAYLVFYYYQAALLDQTGSFSGPGGGCTTTHIGFMKILATDELRRLAKQWGGQIASLADQKQTLEDSLAAKQTRLSTAQQEVDRSANAVAALVAQVAQTEAFVKQINQQEQALPPSVRAELQARDSLDKSIAAVQDQIVAAEQADNTALAETLTARLKRQQAQLATLSRELRGKDGLVDQLLERWLSKLRVLKNQLFAVRSQQVTALSNWTEADNDLEATLGRRAALDQALFAVAEQIARLGVGITGVLLLSSLEPPGANPNAYIGDAGWRVFAAQVPTYPLSIDQLNTDIASVGNVLADLDQQRDVALSNFLAAEQRASAALDNVTQVIWSTAQKKAVVDFISNVIDVIKASRNGGLIGASAETLKKVAETLIKEYAVDAGPGKYGSKGAEEFNADFNAKLTNAYVGKIALKTGVERLVKETVSKKGKDALNKSLGKLVWEKLYGTIPALYEQAAGQISALANPSVDEIKDIQAAVDAKAAQFTALGGSYEGQPVKGPKSLGTTVGDLATTILKDVAKNALKYHFDIQEQQAWTAYFEQEIIARTYFPFYQATADAYWQAYDTYDALMQQKAQLLQGYSPEGDARVTRDDYFPADTTLTILISGAFPYACISQGSGSCVTGTDVSSHLQILIGAVPTKRFSGTEYFLAGPFAAEHREGLGLEFRFS